MPSLVEGPPVIKDSIVTEVPAGSRAVLNCSSNDYDHNFMYWILGEDQVIGPGNPYDEKKYKYEVLSGRLHINNVSPNEAGYYTCVSKKLDQSGHSVGVVEMIVKGAASFSAMDAVKLVAIVVSIIILISCAVIYYRLRKEWDKYDGHTIVPVEDEEEEIEGDEIYNRTTTNLSQPTAVGPSRNQSSDQLLYGIDNQGLDTDFNSVFENIQIKSPPSLI